MTGMNQWGRNVEGLRTHAQKKAETAAISTAWLYGNEDLKQRIMHLRTQQTPKAQVKLPVHEQASNASKEAVIAALRKRIK